MNEHDMNEHDTGPARSMLGWLTVQDSAFPAGRFVHSNGLEAWAAAHPAADEDAIVELVRTAVEGSVAPLDAVFLAHSTSALPDQLPGLDRLLGLHKITAASRTAACDTGYQLAMVATRVIPGAERIGYLEHVLDHTVPGHQAVVEGVVQRHLGVPADLAVLGFLRGAMVGMLSAAVRLGRLGALRAQRALFTDRDTLLDLAESACTHDLDDVWSTTPELELHAMRHETATARLFTT